MQKTVLSFPTYEYRSLPLPSFGASKAKLGTFFIRAEAFPDELKEWMAVNPRVPRFDKKDQLKGPVAKAIINTLEEKPELFEVKNQGVWLLAEKVTWKKEEGGEGVVEVVFEDPARHGLVNGGHTAHAIYEVRDDRKDEGANDKWGAYVRVHVLEGVDSDVMDVTDLAEGLNRSMQVDDPSLANLAGHFDKLKEVMTGKPGAEQIAYRQGDLGEVDILHVLTYAAMFDLDTFPDRKRHPNTLFGHPKAVLRHFLDKKDGAAFEKLLPRIPEILVLADYIQQQAYEHHASRIGRLKISEAKEGNRAGSPKHKDRPAHFAEGVIPGKFAHGWLSPMLAAFRANVSREDWKKGKFTWLVKPKKLLSAVLEEMVDIVVREHQDNNMKPAEVGRKDSAYRLCYSAISMELNAQGLSTV